MSLKPDRDSRHHHSNAEDELDEALDPVIEGERLAALSQAPVSRSVLVPLDTEVGNPLDPRDKRGLVLRWTEDTMVSRYAERGCLAKFLKLNHPNAKHRDRGGTDALLDFTRKWGVLGLWPTLTPMEPSWNSGRHVENSRSEAWFNLDQIGVTTEPEETRKYWYEESVSLWYETAREIETVLRVAKSTQEGKTVGEELIKEIKSLLTFYADWQQSAGEVLEKQQEWIQHTMNEWLGFVQITPSLEWIAPKGKNREKLPERLVVALDADVSWEQFRAWDKLYMEEAVKWERPRRMGRRGAYRHRGARPSTLWGLLMVELLAAITSSDHWYQCGICLAMYPHNTGRRLRWDATPVCEDCQYDHHNRIQRESYHRMHP